MPKGIIGSVVHVGRPTKYIEHKVLKDTRKYIDECENTYERVLESRGKRSVMYSNRFRVKLPMIEGLALRLKVSKFTIGEWRKHHEPFSILIEELLQKQAHMLAHGGLNGEYNPVITKVLLTKHGYREGVEHANPDGSNLFRPNEEEKKIAERALLDM